MRIGRLSKLQRPAHHYVDHMSAVVARFGPTGEWGRDTLPPVIQEAADAIAQRVAERGGDTGGYMDVGPVVPAQKFYRTVFLKMREDGLLYEDFFDYQIGELQDLRSIKERTLEIRAFRFLKIERCAVTGADLIGDAWVVEHRGAYARLSFAGLRKVLFDRPASGERSFNSGSFSAGGSFDISRALLQGCLRDRIDKIKEELIVGGIDSSLLEDYAKHTTDAIREVRRRCADRAQEERAQGQKSAKTRKAKA